MAELTLDGCSSISGSDIEIFGHGSLFRHAWQKLGSFCPRLDRDLALVAPFDGGEIVEPDGLRGRVRPAVFAEEPTSVSSLGLLVACPEACVFCLSGGLETATQWAQEMPSGRVFGLGGRVYSRPARDQMRATQRLLPLHEVTLTTAVLTALIESGTAPLWISINLDVLQPHLVPGVVAVGPGGETLEGLRAALAVVPGDRVLGFEVVGRPAGEHGKEFTALTGAELLRDNILVWWYP